MKRKRIILSGVAFLIIAFLVCLWRGPMWGLYYRVWNTVPGTVVDRDGRVGRLYSNGSNILVAVVFEKGYRPPAGAILDRFLTPPPPVGGIHSEISFDTGSLRCGTDNSDEVFDNFMLRRNQGIGWNGDGMVIVSTTGTGRNQVFVATVNDSEVITVRPGTGPIVPP